MGFVMRLNSRDLVNDPKNGAEVYPITATNAVYRAGTDKNLEQILSELSNNQDRKVIQDLEYISNTNTLRISYTDNTTDNIQLSNLIKNVAVTKNNRTYTITITPTTGSASTYTIELPNVTTSGTGNGLSDISYNSSTNTIIATKSNFLTDITCASGSDINTVGTPSVTTSVSGSTTTLTFHQLKGAKGETGATGATGPQGIQGPAGANGTSTYFYVRYSKNSNGNPMTTTPQSDTQYMGVATSTSSTAPTSYSAYTWSKTKGETGSQGIQGPAGQNGTNGTNGTNATITGATATVGTDNTGVPKCEVTPGGTASARTFAFSFLNINGKDGQDANTNFRAADITVSDEEQFLNAVAYSHGYVYTKYNNTASHLTTDTTTDTSSEGVKQTGPCITRIHMAADISLDTRTMNLSHCKIYGYDFKLTLNGKLSLVGRSAFFESVKFQAGTYLGEKAFDITGESGSIHSKFRFQSCQFNSLNKTNSNGVKLFVVNPTHNNDTVSIYVDGFETGDSANQNILWLDNPSVTGKAQGSVNFNVTRCFNSQPNNVKLSIRMNINTTSDSRFSHDSSVSKHTDSSGTKLVETTL